MNDAHLVYLVAYNNLCYCGRDIRLELGKPPRERIERLAICDVVHENDALCAAVVRRGDRAEAFLTGCVLLVFGN